ncbi:cytosine deaminase [Gynuella sp.]|uniref:cytosine deaminase n=1 Tax=Gynuella sp. TaxID=2969146 RepID=UPI003D0DA5F4
MRIINARLRHQPELFTIDIEQGKFSSITAQTAAVAAADSYDAQGNLLCTPFVEPHIHLDAALTAGQPAWNQSGTLFEGIERWAERKPKLNEQDVRERVGKTLNLLVSQGIQHIRTHIDTTDPQLTALKTLCQIREQVKDKIDLQIVAFPQEGILSFPNGQALMEQALEIGADVIGGIPHFEYTRALGEESMKWVIQLAKKHQKLVDVHCDEIDDPASRFLEVLASEALFNDMGEFVTASHTTAMHSYDNAYCSKLFRLLKKSGIHFVSCPTESIHLQGRFDTFPKRRGVTRVKELHAAGMNVALAEDSIFDPWYSLGNGKMLRVLDAGMHICQMMGYQDFTTALDFITENGARLMHLKDYGITVGNPANCIIIEGEDDYSALRRQGEVLLSIRHGDILMQRTPANITQQVDFTSL